MACVYSESDGICSLYDEASNIEAPGGCCIDSENLGYCCCEEDPDPGYTCDSYESDWLCDTCGCDLNVETCRCEETEEEEEEERM